MKFSLLLISLSISSGYRNVDQDAHFEGGSNDLYHETIDLGASINRRNSQRAEAADYSITGLRFKQNTKTLQSVALKHKQIYSLSCIPMSVEMVLKYNNRVKPDYFRLQQQWKDKVDGNFGNFNRRVIAGLKFTHQFNQPRGKDFPLGRLFKTIDTELAAGRKVIISLPSGLRLWHMYVIDRKVDSGEYAAYSRAYNDEKILVRSDVKQAIRDCNGSDILTYKFVK